MEEHYISSTLPENISYSRLDVVTVLDKDDPMVATSYTMYKIGKCSYFLCIFYSEIYDVNLKFKKQQWERKFVHFVNWLEWLKWLSLLI